MLFVVLTMHFNRRVTIGGHRPLRSQWVPMKFSACLPTNLVADYPPFWGASNLSLNTHPSSQQSSRRPLFGGKGLKWISDYPSLEKLLVPSQCPLAKNPGRGSLNFKLD